MELREIKGKYLDEDAILEIALHNLKNTKSYISPQVPSVGCEFCDILLVGQDYTIIISLKHVQTQQSKSKIKHNIFKSDGFLIKSHNQLVNNAFRNIYDVVVDKNKQRIDIRPNHNKLIYITALGELLDSSTKNTNRGSIQLTTGSSTIVTKEPNDLVIKQTDTGIHCYWGLGVDRQVYGYKTNNADDVSEIIMKYNELLDILAIQGDDTFDSADKIGKFMQWTTNCLKTPYIRDVFVLEVLYNKYLNGQDINGTGYIVIVSKLAGIMKINRKNGIMVPISPEPLIVEFERFTETKKLQRLNTSTEMGSNMIKQMLNSPNNNKLYKFTIDTLKNALEIGSYTLESNIYLICDRKIYKI